VIDRVPVPVPPILAAAGRSGLWVVGHGAGKDPDVLFHYDADGRPLGQTEITHDVTALTLGGGQAWVAVGGVPRLYRFGPSLRRHHAQWLTAPATELAYGAGHVWASVPADDSVARYDPRDNLIVTSAAGRRPAGLAVAGGRVFVASHVDHAVVIVDPRTGKPLGEPLPVPPNPWAVAAGGGHVWVSGLGESSLTRLDY
jgi:DNA-binding beta-propeller fold protein YncE